MNKLTNFLWNYPITVVVIMFFVGYFVGELVKN